MGTEVGLRGWALRWKWENLMCPTVRARLDLLAEGLNVPDQGVVYDGGRTVF